MPKSPTAYYRPDTLQSALQLLNQPHTVALGGGSKLLAHDVFGAVVDLQMLALNQITWNENSLAVGATTTLTELAETLAVNTETDSPASLLQKAIHQAGPNTYRHAATLGGSIASRLPDSELLAALLVLDTKVVLHSPQPHTVSLADYLAPPEQPFGLITGITIPWQAGQGMSERVARTPADYPIVSVVLWLPQTGMPALAATGIAKRPLRLSDAETALNGQFTEERITQAATFARDAVTHPGDFRGDAAYRADMVAILTQRVCQSVR